MDSITSESFLDAAYWQDLCPWLTVTGEKDEKVNDDTNQVGAAFTAGIRSSLMNNGFARVTARVLWSEEGVEAIRDLCKKLEEGIKQLISSGFPPTLIILYTEAWELAAAVGNAIRGGEGMKEHYAIGDWAAFYVDTDGKGWPPHRDRPMCLTGIGGDENENEMRAAAIKASFIDNIPSYVTCWIPLSSAPPESSCLYFVPKNADTGYYYGEAAGIDPLLKILSKDATAVQSVIALPVPRASLLVFSHRTLHWGGRPCELEEEGGKKTQARVALSFALARRDFEVPFLKSGCDSPPDTHLARAGLACAQLLSYTTQAPLNACAAALCADIASKAADAGLFTSSYETRIRATGEWTRFSTSFSHSKVALSGRGGVSAATVDLLFCARAAADAGLSLQGFSP